jgi:hypothetical protein
MCDYSLHGIRNRLAEEGETLVVYRFLTGSKGLTSPGYVKPTLPRKGWLAAIKKFFAADPQVCAVCVPDGAKLIVHGIPQQLQEAHGISASEAVIFRQLSLEVHTYRDAVEFKNGVRVRLQELEEGQRIAVLALSPEEAEIRANLKAAHA